MDPAVPLSMLAIGILSMALGHVRAWRRRHQARSPVAPPTPILVHSINEDRCTGCEACVTVCPTAVLALEEHKARVLRFSACIQCRQCMDVCPTQALVMHREDQGPAPVRAPQLDVFGQTAVPGMYLIGEASGRPLVKNAANLGRTVVEHVARSGLSPSRPADVVDVAIVGSGPGGLSAALTCQQRGLSCVVLEKEQQVASTIARYPRGKLVMAEPARVENLSLLPVRDAEKEDLLGEWNRLIAAARLPIKLGESVSGIARDAHGIFTVTTTVGAYRARRVVLSVGTRGRPRTLGVPGENLAKVSPSLADPTAHEDQDVLVVGGGDSALEAAAALAQHGARVTMSYRGRSFAKAKAENVQRVKDLAATGRLTLLLGSTVTEFAPATVSLRVGDAVRTLPNAAAWVLIGADAPVAWLEALGVRFVDKPHMQPEPPTDRQLAALLGAAPAVQGTPAPRPAVDCFDEEPTRLHVRPPARPATTARSRFDEAGA